MMIREKRDEYIVWKRKSKIDPKKNKEIIQDTLESLQKIGNWNGLKEEVVMAKNVQLKEKMQKIYIQRQDHTSVAQAMYTKTR